MEEIAAEKIIAEYPGDARRAAEELLGSGEDGELAHDGDDDGGDDAVALETEA